MEKISDFIISLLPSEVYTFLIYLLIVTLFSIFLIFILARKNRQKKQNSKKEITIDDLLKIADNPKSTEKDLIFALNYFLNYFKVKNNEKKSFEFFKKILNHKNRSKEIFNIFHGKILPANLEYKNELDKLEKRALNK